MQHDIAGDPITGVRWTRRTTEKIAAELHKLGLQVCSNTVARLLKEFDFKLRVNHKRLSRASDPDRDAQFAYIARQKEDFMARGLPVLSVDSKKRELVGNFRNSGRTWERRPRLVNEHDFPSDADGVALPYGVYDLGANIGSLFVGTTHDTPAFAAANLARWWVYDGRRRYPDATELLILADGGGSNAVRTRAWKHSLQELVCDRHGLTVTVCHYPTSTSKWNPIEHRMFSEISKNWAGVPLHTYETILKHARTTRTQTGLKVKSYLVRTHYPTGVKISDRQMDAIHLDSHQIQPARNYTIRPRSTACAQATKTGSCF